MAKKKNPSPTAFFPGQKALKNRIVVLFAKNTALTALEIRSLLHQKENQYTLQAVYQELRSLTAEGIVQKIGPRYALNSPWILQLQSFAAQLASTSFSGRSGLATLTGKVRRQTWKFDNLLAMNELWGHILVDLTRHAKRKLMLKWLPHLWFDLFQWEQEDRFLRSYRYGGNRVMAIIGADCFLNRYATKLFDKHDIAYSFAPGPFRQQMDSYIITVDDYITTVRLTSSLAQRLDRSLRAVKNLSGFIASDLASLFVKNSSCTLILEFNPSKALLLRRRFGEYFGENFT